MRPRTDRYGRFDFLARHHLAGRVAERVDDGTIISVNKPVQSAHPHIGRAVYGRNQVRIRANKRRAAEDLVEPLQAAVVLIILHHQLPDELRLLFDHHVHQGLAGGHADDDEDRRDDDQRDRQVGEDQLESQGRFHCGCSRKR